MGRALPLGVWSPVTLDAANRPVSRLRLSVHDLHPAELACATCPRPGPGPAPGPSPLPSVRPIAGTSRFTGCARAIRSRWAGGRTRLLPPAETLRVFPNFAEISRYTLLAANDQLAQLGVRRLRRLGTGAEFHQLREYREGDALRQIDWKATSRMRKLIAREYQDERDQRLVFLLDCGRRMRHEMPAEAGDRRPAATWTRP